MPDDRQAVLVGGVVERVRRHRDRRRRDNVRPLLLMRKVRGPVGVGDNGGRGGTPVSVLVVVVSHRGLFDIKPF